MTNPLEFLQEVRAEGAKVTWPTRRETLVTTGLVIFMVLLASFFFARWIRRCAWSSPAFWVSAT